MQTRCSGPQGDSVEKRAAKAADRAFARRENEPTSPQRKENRGIGVLDTTSSDTRELSDGVGEVSHHWG